MFYGVIRVLWSFVVEGLPPNRQREDGDCLVRSPFSGYRSPSSEGQVRSQTGYKYARKLDVSLFLEKIRFIRRSVTYY